MVDWRGAVATSDVGWNHLETLVDIGCRMAGTDGEHRAAIATRDALASYTGDASVTEFPIQGWQRASSSISTVSTEESCIALPRSPSGEVHGELIDLGHALPDDFAERDLNDAIVLARSDVPNWYDRYIHRREKYFRAVEADAAGFVYQNHVPGCLPPTGSVGTPDSPIGEIPAVGVSAETGSRLSRRFGAEDIKLEVETTISDATSHNVHAAIGPDTETEVLVTSHIDAHDIAEGALDNGAGTAALLEIVHALSHRETDLDTRVHFIAFGAEEVGLVGSEYCADRMDAESIRAVLNLDGVVRGRDLSVTTHRCSAFADAIERVADRLGHPVTVSPEVAPHSDHWPFVKQGVAGAHVMSETGSEGRGWGHTAADTLDKLDRRDLREQCLLLTELTVELAKSDHPQEGLDRSALKEALESDNLLEGMRITGDWPD